MPVLLGAGGGAVRGGSDCGQVCAQPLLSETSASIEVKEPHKCTRYWLILKVLGLSQIPSLLITVKLPKPSSLWPPRVCFSCRVTGPGAPPSPARLAGKRSSLQSAELPGSSAPHLPPVHFLVC